MGISNNSGETLDFLKPDQEQLALAYLSLQHPLSHAPARAEHVHLPGFVNEQFRQSSV